MKPHPAQALHALANPVLANPTVANPTVANPTLADLARAIDTRRAELRAKTVLSQARVLVATSGLVTASTEWETRVIGFLDQATGN